MAFGNDAFLGYNVGEFGQLGLAVPNFGDDTKSQNSTIRNLAEVIGRNLQAIMFTPMPGCEPRPASTRCAGSMRSARASARCSRAVLSRSIRTTWSPRTP